MALVTVAVGKPGQCPVHGSVSVFHTVKTSCHKVLWLFSWSNRHSIISIPQAFAIRVIGIFDISYSLVDCPLSALMFAVFAAIKFPQPIPESFRSFTCPERTGNIVVGDDGLGLGTSGRCSHFQYIQNVSSFRRSWTWKAISVPWIRIWQKFSQFLDMGTDDRSCRWLARTAQAPVRPCHVCLHSKSLSKGNLFRTIPLLANHSLMIWFPKVSVGESANRRQRPWTIDLRFSWTGRGVPVLADGHDDAECQDRRMNFRS